MTVIRINVKRREHFQQLRKEIGAFLFMKRQQRNFTLEKAAAKAKLTPGELDNVELGRCNLRSHAIIRLLGLYRTQLCIRFDDRNQSAPIVEAK